MSKGKRLYEVTYDGELYNLNTVSTVTGCAMKYALLYFYGKYGNKKAKQIANDAAQVGKDTHAYTEAFFKNLKTITYVGDVNKIRNCVANFKLLVKKYKLKPLNINSDLALEVMVYSIKHKFAGTFDGLFEGINPKTKKHMVVLLDWKTSSGIWDDYYLQIEGYYRALTEMVERGIIKLEGKIDELWIARLDKEEQIDFDRDIRILIPGNEDRFKAFLGLLDYLIWTQLKKERK